MTKANNFEPSLNQVEADEEEEEYIQDQFDPIQFIEEELDHVN